MRRRWHDVGGDVESTVRVYLAGRVFVEAGELLVTGSDLPGRQGRLLFVVLAADHRRAIPHEELAGLVWGEELPAAWETALRALVADEDAVLVAGLVMATLGRQSAVPLAVVATLVLLARRRYRYPVPAASPRSAYAWVFAARLLTTT